MTTPLDDPIITITPVLTTGPATNGSITIPASQRRTGDTARDLALPAGVHHVSLTWRGPLSVGMRLRSGADPASRVVVTLPGGVDAKPVIVQVVVAEPGGVIWFGTSRVATEEEVAGGYGNLGVTVYLNPARKPLG